MNKKEKTLQEMENKFKLSKETRDIIHGYIMSDGYVNENGALTVDQSLKQKKFAEWLYNKLESIRTDSPIVEVERLHKKTNKKSYSCRFNTLSTLKGFRSMWYKLDKSTLNSCLIKKCLPLGIRGFFSPIFITVWFAGDGTKIIGSKGGKFEVTAFSVDERLLLQRLFKEKYDIEVKINKAGFTSKGKQQWTLNVNAPEYAKFKEIITQSDLITTLFPGKIHAS